MPGIVVGNNESIDSALKRFKKQVEKGGVLSEARRGEYYENPARGKRKSCLPLKSANKTY
jgi:small subunit ribosomal protein S21